MVDDLAQGPTKYMGICKYIPQYHSTSKKKKKKKKNKKNKTKDTEKGDGNGENDNNNDNVIEEDVAPGTIPASFKFEIPSFDEANLLLTYDDNENNKDKNKDESDDIDDDEEDEDSEDDDMEYPFRRIDMKYIDYSQYFAGLLYFTGSDDLNRHMRIKANEKELILNETGVYEMLDADDHSKKGKRVIVPTSEQDIFECLGMEYIEPEDRSW